ncbi:hypothetical protein ACHHYP_11102 [Achlya hypogyna]|uniref:Uncharacterized protein n=1 Tax=Achlya hypogyna TaxID=1202772 RepID=A0A1V9YJV5_ACHHY|nr:hypothetical protein ACHHYP_11102 [Achlya hypogyna]
MTTCYFNDCGNLALTDSSKCEFHKHRLKCLMDDCHNQVYARRLCVRHGGKKLCDVPDCSRNARLGKFCSLHGIATHKRHCNEEGCTKMAHARGKCVRHGGGRRCEHPGCPSHARHKGFCSRHTTPLHLPTPPTTPLCKLEAKPTTISPRWPTDPPQISTKKHAYGTVVDASAMSNIAKAMRALVVFVADMAWALPAPIAWDKAEAEDDATAMLDAEILECLVVGNDLTQLVDDVFWPHEGMRVALELDLEF